MRFLLIILTIINFHCHYNQPDNRSNLAFHQYLEAQQEKSFDLAIINGIIYSGNLEDEPFHADILIHKDTITFIGKIDTSAIHIRTLIDAETRAMAPGFIDMHAHGNPLKNGNFSNFLAMGVTTICLGQDGSSPMYEDPSEYFELLDKQQINVNIVPFVGHGTLRIMSGIQYKKNPDPEGLEKQKKLLIQALDAGCFGLSTGLEYTPGRYAGENELIGLAKIVGEYDRLISSHMRNEDDDQLFQSISEFAKMGLYTRINISHIKSVYGNGTSRGQEIRSFLNDLRDEGVQITQDLYPYTASYTGTAILFPEWALPPNNYQKVRAKQRGKLLNYVHRKIAKRKGPQAMLIGTGMWKGKTLQQVSDELSRPYAEVMVDLIGPAGTSAAYFVMDDSLQQELMLDPLTMICSDGSPTMHHPRGYGTFAKIIQEFIIKRKVLDLQDAIYKMSTLPARTLGLKKHGMIKPGYVANVVLFHPEEVKAKATFTEPHLRSQGFDYVIVNGRVAWKNESSMGNWGHLLRYK